MIGALIMTATVLTMSIGIAGLLIVCYYAWDYTFKLILVFFKIHGLFIEFMYQRHRKNRVRPSINHTVSKNGNALAKLKEDE